MITLRGFLHAGQPSLRLGDQGENASAADAGDGAARCDDADDKRYRLISIDAANAPEGCTGGDWFVYRITQGLNGITGYRRGSLERVSADVQSIVGSLNGRRNWTKIKPAPERQRRVTGASHKAAR